jgi:hypothetical protein
MEKEWNRGCLHRVPGVLLPQGTTGKPHEQTQRRRITDAGAPRAPLTSRDCTVVMPINEGVRVALPDGPRRTQPKEKPASDVTVNDSGNLAYVARAMALDGFAPHKYLAFLACDDFKAFFNQFALHPSEWSRFCLAFLRGGDLCVASERVLGFGCAPSSGIAQRFAHLVRKIVTERMIAADAPFVAELRRRPASTSARGSRSATRSPRRPAGRRRCSSTSASTPTTPAWAPSAAHA